MVFRLFSTKYLEGFSLWSQFKQKWQLFTLVCSCIYIFTLNVSVHFPLVPTCLHNDADQVDRRRPKGHFAIYTSELPERLLSHAKPSLTLTCGKTLWWCFAAWTAKAVLAGVAHQGLWGLAPPPPSFIAMSSQPCSFMLCPSQSCLQVLPPNTGPMLLICTIPVPSACSWPTHWMTLSHPLQNLPHSLLLCLHLLCWIDKSLLKHRPTPNHHAWNTLGTLLSILIFLS